jgi:hypothetical protein
MRPVPQRRVRFLQRFDLHRHVVELVVLAVPGEAFRRERLQDQLQPLRVDCLPFFRILAVERNLVGHRAAAEADLHASAAQMIEHADFFQHAQRMMQRQRIDERAEAQPFGALRDRREENAGRRRHAERREVMLGDVIRIEAAAIERLDHLEPVFVVIPQREVVAVEVIEDAEFEGHADTVAIYACPGQASAKRERRSGTPVSLKQAGSRVCSAPPRGAALRPGHGRLELTPSTRYAP